MRTKKGAAVGFTDVFFEDGVAVARAFLFGVRKPVLFEGKSLFPFEELEAVMYGFMAQGPKFCGRQVGDFVFGVNAYAKEYFILTMLPPPEKSAGRGGHGPSGMVHWGLGIWANGLTVEFNGESSGYAGWDSSLRVVCCCVSGAG